MIQPPLKSLRAADSVSTRLVALVALSAIPLMLLAGTIVWQNYQLALRATDDSVIRLRSAVVARIAAGLSGARHVLGTVAHLPDVEQADARACGARLASILTIEPERYDNIMWVTGGVVRCSARPIRPPLPAPISALERAGTPPVTAWAIGRVVQSHALGLAILPVAQQTSAGTLIATLNLGWLGGAIPDRNGGSAWLFNEADNPVVLGPSDPGALPRKNQLAKALSARSPRRLLAIDGQRFSYASAQVAPNLNVLLASPAEADIASARMLLISWLVQLGIFLLLGLAALTYGTDRALAKPIRRLRQAVSRWEAGEKFPAHLEGTPPQEVQNLTDAFRTAIASLEKQSVALQEAAQQQDLLMKEIHHRVKNNLQIVASLLNLQASRIRVPAARAEFASARDRVRALATLHRHLYSQGTLTRIAMRPFLQELIGQLFEAMGEREGNRIHLSLDASDVELGSDQAVPLALIVTEAVSNALKYAFPGGRAGNVTVRFQAIEQFAELTIADDGVGIPSAPADTETGRRDGLGAQLIRGFAQQLGATLDTSHRDGTRYTIRFQPLHVPPAL